MPNEVLVAIIGVAGSALGSLIGVLSSSKLTAYRIEQLEKKVDKHNNLIERTYKLEEEAAILSEKITVANHRVDDLEKASEK